MYNPFFSIVIPTYCSENYINNAISSIKKQDFNQWEIVVVDDGSTDSTVDIVKNIESADSRVKIIESSHKGTQMARYIGMTNAIGKYILFLDSDDVLENQALGIIFEILKKYPSDILIIGMKMLYEDGTIITQNEEFETGYIDKIELFEKMIRDRIVKSLGRKVVSKTLITSEDSFIVSNIMRYGEDMFQSLQFLARAESIYFINLPLYVYQIRNNSTMFTFYANKYKDRIMMYNGISYYGKMLGLIDEKLQKLANYYLLSHVVDCIDEIKESGLSLQKKEELYTTIYHYPAISKLLDLRYELELTQRQISVLSQYKDIYE